ncbi:unnamed protein product [Protopolystoma xenopodis]|uniref:Uncharacterized protein n=1 Tax=Protopolystoma xenopodis TaxID=117903 RepID=A0A3S5AFX4_9PLAT|nr:unnamed protein product [Protopolystoma xenopodis]
MVRYIASIADNVPINCTLTIFPDAPVHRATTFLVGPDKVSCVHEMGTTPSHQINRLPEAEVYSLAKEEKRAKSCAFAASAAEHKTGTASSSTDCLDGLVDKQKLSGAYFGTTVLSAVNRSL